MKLELLSESGWKTLTLDKEWETLGKTFVLQWADNNEDEENEDGGGDINTPLQERQKMIERNVAKVDSEELK